MATNNQLRRRVDALTQDAALVWRDGISQLADLITPDMLARHEAGDATATDELWKMALTTYGADWLERMDKAAAVLGRDR